VGSEVEAQVEQFSSHGAYTRIGQVQAYVPLKYLAEPAPRSAKQVLRLGETRSFIVVAIEPARRGIDLALPGLEPPGVVPEKRAAKRAKDKPKKASARK
jgi:ribosomal protein S1